MQRSRALGTGVFTVACTHTSAVIKVTEECMSVIT